jgi:hypothetical protein
MAGQVAPSMDCTAQAMLGETSSPLTVAHRIMSSSPGWSHCAPRVLGRPEGELRGRFGGTHPPLPDPPPAGNPFVGGIQEGGQLLVCHDTGRYEMARAQNLKTHLLTRHFS